MPSMQSHPASPHSCSASESARHALVQREPGAGCAASKDKAIEFGADTFGICEIEPSDVYQGRTVAETYAIAVGQRMRWRAFEVVPESVDECLRVYFTLSETVIRLAVYLRSLGHACRVEHPIGDSDLVHIPIGLQAGFGEASRRIRIARLPTYVGLQSHGFTVFPER